MDTKFLNQHLIISTLNKLKHYENTNILSHVLQKNYLKEKLNSNNFNFETYSDALVAILNEANKDKKEKLIENILSTTDAYVINEIKKNPPFAEYIMVFLNYLYFDLYFGTERATNPKKIKSFMRNEKSIEISNFRNTILNNLGVDSPIYYKINRISEIVNELNYKSVEEFRSQLDKIVEYIDRIFKNLVNLDAVPITFVFKNIYLPYQGLVYRVNGNKESKEAEQFNFLAHKTLLSIISYKHLYYFLENFKIDETDFSYLEQIDHSIVKNHKVSNLAELSILMCKVLIELSDDNLSPEQKQILYLFYQDIELLTWEYNALIEYLI